MLSFRKKVSGCEVAGFFLLFFPAVAWAQEHGCMPLSEFITGQIADIVLFIPLIYLCFFIKKTVGKKNGWHYIYLAILLFAFWSLQHMTEDILGEILCFREGYFSNDSLILKDYLSYIYYLLKLGRPWVGLFGMLCLYLGLRNLTLSEKEASKCLK